MANQANNQRNLRNVGLLMTVLAGAILAASAPAGATANVGGCTAPSVWTGDFGGMCINCIASPLAPYTLACQEYTGVLPVGPMTVATPVVPFPKEVEPVTTAAWQAALNALYAALPPACYVDTSDVAVCW